MPSSRTILLLLAVLPGLLVPAGMGLDRCDCTGALRLVVHDQPPACRATTHEVVLEGTSCCQRSTLADRSENPDADHLGLCNDGAGCACQASIVPHAPTKHRAEVANPQQPLTHCTPWSSPALQPTRHGYVRAWIASRSPPDPHQQRNRPLLL